MKETRLTGHQRYTLTYTPAVDRILPAPSQLHVRIKNTSAIPLRAAYLHGPYGLYVACYPSTFDPYKKYDGPREEGSPDFEPMVKAGGHWSSRLVIPEEVKATAGGPLSSQNPVDAPKSITWIIEIASQILFSNSASVNYELLVGRDEKSVEAGFHSVSSDRPGVPGRLEDFQRGQAKEPFQRIGVFSKAIKLVVDDTEKLWNKPAFPSWNDGQPENAQRSLTSNAVVDQESDRPLEKRSRKRKRVHLVVLTHGLHSNLGADMLYMKESIDAAACQAREDSRRSKAAVKAEGKQQKEHEANQTHTQRSESMPEVASSPTNTPTDAESDDEDEQVIVRGFSGNAVRTERGIQYLGKRLAKYTLSITYPDQPYLPVKSTISKTLTRSLAISKSASDDHPASHKHSTVKRDEEHTHGDIGYKITSISFIGHSLGGLVQTYAIAYIQKHSPDFFDRIKPINFVGLATPWLGLSNENPIYVKFALDFGLVGRTGQDLGLTWRTPALVRSGWGAMIGGLGKEAQKATHQPDPASKPLLRVLPSGPAHAALQKFRNRTVYSNVVNDGIVPLRTSCLLFLDWRGLDRVEKARRDMGLVGTMVGWGWNEMMGANASSPRPKWADIFSDSGEDSEGRTTPTGREHEEDVPQPESTATTDDIARNSERATEPRAQQFLNGRLQTEAPEPSKATDSSKSNQIGPFAGFLSLFKPASSSKTQPHATRQSKMYRRGQTMRVQGDGNALPAEQEISSSQPTRVRPVRGSSLYTSAENGDVEAPPRTTFFESAGDILNPPLPPKEYLLDPAARPRTIFHDRVYHPEDIPQPPIKKRAGLGSRSISRDSVQVDPKPSPSEKQEANDVLAGSVKIEEKIARAYHKDLSWRKVLVRLEPDAHNNMIVRRMFANAYGWPVIKHLVDTHFAYTDAALTEDALEQNTERAAPTDAPIGSDGEHVRNQAEPPQIHDNKMERSKSDGDRDSKYDLFPSQSHHSNRHRTESEIRESQDAVPDLKSPSTAAESSYSSAGRSSTTTSAKLSRQDSAVWSDRFFGGSDDDSDFEIGPDNSFTATPPEFRQGTDEPAGTSATEIAEFLGKGPVKERSLRSSGQPRPLSSAKAGDRPKDNGLESPPLQDQSTSIVGLQTPPKDSVLKVGKGEPEMGISEQVAFAQAKRAEDGPDD